MSHRHVAVIADVHGVLPALEAVLAEPDVAGAELVVAAGDLLAGPQPGAVLDALDALGPRLVLVRGNADRELDTLRRTGRGGPEGLPAWADISPWAAEQLTDDRTARLAALPTTRELDVDGLGRVLFCHATPRDDEETVLVDSRPDRWAEVFEGLDPGIGTVVCGHTHMPFARLAHGRLVVNPGSVGMPYGRPGAHWALLGPGVQLRRTLFDADAACARIAAESGFPYAAEWARAYLRDVTGDVEALAAFGPGDGRDDGRDGAGFGAGFGATGGAAGPGGR